MKLKRYKQVRKVLNFYKQQFNLKAPFKILLDGTFCKTALTYKVNIADQVKRYLDEEIEFGTTNCVLKELESFGSLLYGPLKVLRQFPALECNHEPPISAEKCLRHFTRQKLKKNIRYFVASQDPKISECVRDMRGIPLLYISRHTIVLEGPSETSKKIAAKNKKQTLELSSRDNQLLKLMKSDHLEPVPEKKRKRKGPRGPNPLSCMKAKKEKSTSINQNGIVKRKRIRVKLSKHVKEIWIKEGKWPIKTNANKINETS
ncbi:DgyrCDS6650 [Dimorphilus gyrociliatus]|uniref:rRNA-processing protein UTP23 homolog n=1 Tax=Dimorphilus gyrociliatus TaxID=2664684 RepID=A0A7I8VQ80_9ANNE|nr:DgyrCDS6650 [Dimorphilus gyrociliatus]